MRYVKAFGEYKILSFRLILGVAGAIAGAIALTRDDGLGITFLVFGAFTIVHVAFDCIVVVAEGEAGPKPAPTPASGDGQAGDKASTAQTDTDTDRASHDRTASGALLGAYQDIVLTASGTILGLIAAFQTRPLPDAVDAAVIGLGVAILAVIVNRASGARTGDSRAATMLGLYTDVVAFCGFALGVIGIVVSLVIAAAPSEPAHTTGPTTSVPAASTTSTVTTVPVSSTSAAPSTSSSTMPGTTTTSSSLGDGKVPRTT